MNNPAAPISPSSTPHRAKRKAILFAGAPRWETLVTQHNNNNNEQVLRDDLEPAFQRFLGLAKPACDDPSRISRYTSTADEGECWPKWRVLRPAGDEVGMHSARQLKRRRVIAPNRPRQQGEERHREGGDEVGTTELSFLSTCLEDGDASTTEIEVVDNDFLEHSFAVYNEGITNLQDVNAARPEPAVAAAAAAAAASFVDDGETTLLTNSTGMSASSSYTSTPAGGTPNPTTPSAKLQLQLHLQRRDEVPAALPITNLHHLPSASTLRAKHPQTLTVNLIAGVIARLPARTVQLRPQPNAFNKNGSSSSSMDIVELLLGDETRTGFTVSFWLQPPTASSSPSTSTSATNTVGKSERQRSRGGRSSTQGAYKHDSTTTTTRTILSTLRSGDVVVLKYVALQEWKGVVYGQSLRGVRGRPSLTLVQRMDDVDAAQLPRVHREKMESVVAWMDRFLGPTTTIGDTRLAGREGAMSTKGSAGAAMHTPGNMHMHMRNDLELPPDTQ